MAIYFNKWILLQTYSFATVYNKQVFRCNFEQLKKLSIINILLLSLNVIKIYLWYVLHFLLYTKNFKYLNILLFCQPVKKLQQT